MYKRLQIFFTLLVLLIFGVDVCNAQPYGVGVYNNDLPYGSETALSISTDGDVEIPANPTEEGQLSKGTSTITVTSTDVVGYKLYIRSLTNTYMDSGDYQIPASSNNILSPLSVDTWGYNTDGSDNFLGITSEDVLIRSTTNPTPSGENTAVTFGVNIDMAKGAGNYSTSVIYTAVPQTD